MKKFLMFALIAVLLVMSGKRMFIPVHVFADSMNIENANDEAIPDESGAVTPDDDSSPESEAPELEDDPNGGDAPDLPDEP